MCVCTPPVVLLNWALMVKMLERLLRYSFSTARLWFLLFTALLIASSQSVVSQYIGVGQSNVSPAKPTPRDKFFGMHIHRVEAIKNADGTPGVPSVAFGSWRLWDAGVAWMNLEPRRGVWDFNKLDRYVALAEKYDIDVLLPLALTPQWASARPNEPCPYSKGCAAAPRDLLYWENYVRVVATRYKGRIRNYEIWNEPDFISAHPSTFFSGTPEEMVALARSAYWVIKSIDPKAIVTTPATVAELERLDPYLRLGGGQFADVVAGHFYTSPPENLVALIARFKAVMKKYGLEHKPLWNTESGFLIANPLKEVRATPGSGVFERVLSESEAAAYVARSLILAKANGIERSYWYAWDNFRMALSRSDAGAPNLAGQAYQKVVQWLENALIEKCSVSDKAIWVCNINRSDGPSRIVWNASGTIEWSVPADWKARTYQTLDGQTTKITSQKLLIGSSPMMLYSGN